MEGRDPAGVQREIESAQQRLAWAVDEITDRTNPKNVARRGLHQLRDTGEGLIEEARSLVTGSQVVRGSSHVVEPAEGSVVTKSDEQWESTYSTRSLPPSTVLISVGAGVALAVGAYLVWRRRRRG